MRKVLCILFTALLLIGALAIVSSAAPAEYEVGDTVTFEKDKEIFNSNTGSYPVYESTHRHQIIESVTSKNDCAKVEKTSSGWIVTFVKSGTAKIEVKSHVHESYSKYNTDEQKVYKNYHMDYPSETATYEYTVISLADSYKVPDGYVSVYKDGYEYIDFASQEVINAKFGESTLIKYANLKDFFGFSYGFENNTFIVTLNNFTGQGLFFHCPKKDTTVMIHLKGTNTLTGTGVVFNKEIALTDIAATGSNSYIWIDASEKGATLNANIEVASGKNDSAAFTRYVPFFAYGGTEIVQTTVNCRPTVNVNLSVPTFVGNRAVNLALNDLTLANADFNYTYNTNGYLKNYSGVTGTLFLDQGTIFTGTLKNTQASNTTAEYLFPKITYAKDFNGGAYFECTGGNLVKERTNEIFISNSLLQYATVADGTQYRAVTAYNNDLLTPVEPANIATAFPDVHVNKALPKLMDGLTFKAGIYWTDENGQTADYAEKNHTYRARVTFVPTKGFYVYVRNLTTAEKAAAKPASVLSVSNINQPNTTTTRYDTLDFQLHKIQAGSPTFSEQPKSVIAEPGEVIYFNAPAINTNPSPDGYEWYSVSNVTFLGITIPWATRLSDNAVYSGTTTSKLRVVINENLYKVRYYYCKINGTGWDSVRSNNATIAKAKHITKIALSVYDPVPGYGADRGGASGLDYDHYAFYSVYKEYRPSRLTSNMESSYGEILSPAVKLDYTTGESTTDGCYWYKGESTFAKKPDELTGADIFQIGETYTYRFHLTAKSGYRFSSDVDFSAENKDEMIIHSFRMSDTEYLVDFTYRNITETLPKAGKQPAFLGVPVLYENCEFTASTTLASSSGAGYKLIAQEGWLASPDENAKPVVPKINGTYYIHYTLVANEGYTFASSGYAPTLYSAEGGKSISYDTAKYVVSDESNTTVEVYLGFKCTQKRIKDLTLNGLAVPSVGSKLGTTASVDPALVNVTKIKYLDMGFNELQDTYVPKAKDMLTVSVFVKAKDGVSFASNAVMTWTVTGNKLSANAYKTAGMADNERCFDFNVSVHEHEWANIENVAFLKETATCLNGTIYYQSCVFCEAQGANTFEMDDKNPHAGAKVAAKAATCTGAGNKEYYQCGTCMKLFSDAACTKEIKTADVTVKATGHKWGAWTKLNDTQHQRVCSNDKTHVEKANHTWDAGTVTKTPTTTETGVRTFTCTVCKGTKTESIPKTAYLLGDVDLNGKVEAGDARLALRAAVGLETFAAGSVPAKAADADKNSKIEAADARLILRAAVGLELLG